jgi:hypothetical protein
VPCRSVWCVLFVDCDMDKIIFNHKHKKATPNKLSVRKKYVNVRSTLVICERKVHIGNICMVFVLW